MDKFIPDGIYIYIYVCMYVFICMYVYMYIYIYIYSIMKTICPPGYHHSGFVATHALGDIMYTHPALCVLWITSDHLYKYINYINIYTHTSTHTHTHTHTYIIYIYIYIYTYIYTHTPIYIYKMN